MQINQFCQKISLFCLRIFFYRLELCVSGQKSKFKRVASLRSVICSQKISQIGSKTQIFNLQRFRLYDRRDDEKSAITCLRPEHPSKTDSSICHAKVAFSKKVSSDSFFLHVLLFKINKERNLKETIFLFLLQINFYKIRKKYKLGFMMNCSTSFNFNMLRKSDQLVGRFIFAKNG